MNSTQYAEYRQLLSRRRYDEAAGLAESQYQKDSPGNPFWLTRQAAAFSRAGKYEPALAIARQALLLRPSDPYALLAAAEAYKGLNRITEALACFEEIAEVGKLAVYARKGVLECLADLKQWQRMLDLLGCWELLPEVALRWKAMALAGLERRDDAIAVCLHWLELKPDNTAGLWALTELEIQRDGLEAVLAKMARLAKISSRPPVYKEIYASLCKRAGMPELALKQYASLSRAGADPRIQRKQAFVLAKSGRENEAIPIMEELLKLSAGDFYLHSAYAAACGRVYQLQRALQFYQELLERYPEEKSLYGRIRKIKRLINAD